MTCSEKRKNAAVEKSHWLKENGPCKQCGTDKRLEIDHILPESKHPRMRTSKIFFASEKIKTEELKKCQVLCKRCHLIKTAKENSYPDLFTQDEVNTLWFYSRLGFGEAVISRILGLSKHRIRDVLRGESYKEFSAKRLGVNLIKLYDAIINVKKRNSPSKRRRTSRITR